MDVRFLLPLERKYSCWIGGSIIAYEDSPFDNNWISCSEYAEYGPNIIETK